MDVEGFLRLPGVVSNTGATGAEIAAFEAQTGLTMLPELQELYAASNGFAINRNGWMRLNTLEEVARYDDSFRRFALPGQWGYFAFTDRNDSNPHCVCCDGPAKGYIVRVKHDDVAAIEYRNLDSFLRTLRDVIELPESDDGPSLWNLPRDFYPDTSDRTVEDVATAHRLLAFASALEENTIERADAERWAITLFSENEIGEIAHLLDVGDEYRREEALAKLTPMTSPTARTAIQQHRREMREFNRQVVAALKQAGLDVAEVTERGLRIEPGRVWLNVAMFFTHRRRPTILADVVQRGCELIAYKTQGKT
jgi:hypothetical protein